MVNDKVAKPAQFEEIPNGQTGKEFYGPLTYFIIFILFFLIGFSTFIAIFLYNGSVRTGVPFEVFVSCESEQDNCPVAEVYELGGERKRLVVRQNSEGVSIPYPGRKY